MDAHRIKVLDRTDNHAVVVPVPHDLHLELLPAQERFLDQHLGYWRKIQPPSHNHLKLLAVVSDAAPGPAQSEGRPDDQRHGPDFLRHRTRFLHGVRSTRTRHVQTDLEHGVLERLAVLALVDGSGIRTDHADPVLFKNPALKEFHGAVQRRLSAQRGQQRIGFFAFDDSLHDLGCDRLDVGPVGKLRVRHDRGRVGIDQDDVVPLLLERLAGLNTRVIEFASLPNHNGAGTNQQDSL